MRISIKPTNMVDRAIASGINRAKRDARIVGYHMKQTVKDIRTKSASQTIEVA